MLAPFRDALFHGVRTLTPIQSICDDKMSWLTCELYSMENDEHQKYALERSMEI